MRRRNTGALKTGCSTAQPLLLRCQICRVIVQEGGYSFAMVGRAEHDAEKSVTMLAEFTDDGQAMDDTYRVHSAVSSSVRAPLY